MRREIVLEILLICILGVTGWYLYNTSERAKLNSPAAKRIETYNKLVFDSGAGIDVIGNKIDSVRINTTYENKMEEKIDSSQTHDRPEKQQFTELDGQNSQKINTNDRSGIVVAFLLRYDNLENDLKFWNEVNSLLSEKNIVKLTAYCDSSQCIEIIKNDPDIAQFVVLEYGGVTDIQAVIGADESGEFWLRGDEFRKIKWRHEIVTPYDAVRSIEQ